MDSYVAGEEHGGLSLWDKVKKKRHTRDTFLSQRTLKLTRLRRFLPPAVVSLVRAPFGQNYSLFFNTM